MPKILFEAIVDAAGAVTGLKGLEQSVKDVGDKGETAGQKTDNFGTSIKNVVAAAAGAVAIQQLVGFLKGSAEAAMEAEVAAARLEAVYKATGGTVGLTIPQLQGLATEMQNMTGVSDETVMAAESILLTFRSIQGEAFPRTMQAAADLSAVFKQDLTSSVTMLGKALEDPERGMSALRRVGVSFTEEQQNVIKAMVETNNLAGAQAEILKVVEMQVGGTAAAMGQTLKGQLDILNETWGDAKEAIGGFVLEAINTSNVVPTLTTWISGLTEGLAELAGKNDAANTSQQVTAHTLEVLIPKRRDEIAALQEQMRQTDHSSEAYQQQMTKLQRLIEELRGMERQLPKTVEQEKLAEEAATRTAGSTEAAAKATQAYNKEADAFNKSQFPKAVEDLAYQTMKAEANTWAIEKATAEWRKGEEQLTVPLVKVSDEITKQTLDLAKQRKEAADHAEELGKLWDGLAKRAAAAFGTGFTDGVLGVFSGDDFKEAFSSIWKNLWGLAGQGLDTMFMNLFQGGSFQQGLEKAGLIGPNGQFNYAGGAMMAGGMLWGAGAAKGNRGMGALGGAVSGAGMGFTVGGVPGAVIGAVVGAIIGYFTSGAPSKETVNAGFSGGRGRVMEVTGQDPAREQQYARMLTEKYQTVNASLREVLSLMDVPLEKMPDIKLGLNLKTRDVQGVLDAFLNETLPRAIFDTYKGALTTGLSGLGVSSGRITQEMDAFGTVNFDKAIAAFKTWILALKDLIEIQADYGKSLGELRDLLSGGSRDTWGAYTKEFGDGLAKLTISLADLTSSEQVARAQHVADLAREYFETSLDYLGQLFSAQDELNKSFGSIFLGFDETRAKEAGADALATFYQDQINALMGQIAGTSSPEALQEIIAQIQKFGQSLWGLGGGEAPIEGARQFAEDALREAQQLANAQLTVWQDEVKTQLASFKDAMQVFSDALMGEAVVIQQGIDDGARDEETEEINRTAQALDDLVVKLQDASLALFDFAAKTRYATPKRSA